LDDLNPGRPDGIGRTAHAQRRLEGVWWLLATIVGVAGSLPSVFVIAAIANRAVGTPVEDQLPYGLLLGLTVGIMQWLVLRRFVSQAGLWILATTAGLVIGRLMWTAVEKPVYGLIGHPLIVGDPFSIMSLISTVAFGATTGLLQWLVLRRQFSHAGWWLLVSPVAWGAGSLAIRQSPDMVTDLIVVGAVYGAITALAVVLLLGRRRAAM
jgi:hypothetical protein